MRLGENRSVSRIGESSVFGRKLFIRKFETALLPMWTNLECLAILVKLSSISLQINSESSVDARNWRTSICYLCVGLIRPFLRSLESLLI